MIVAHRGASGDAPENTLPAFNLAWEQGADAVEGDFRLTKDGRIVCIHDKDTKKISNTKLIVADATLAELRTLDVGGRCGEAFRGTVIPTIAEVFLTVPEHKSIYIEIKCGPEIIAPLLKEIEKSGLAAEQVVVISFSTEVIRALKEKAPQYKALWISKVKKNLSGKTTPSPETVLATLKQIRADGFSSNKNAVDEVFVRRIKEEGYEYHVWTVDKARTARRLSEWGIDSITTNVPGLLRKALAEKGNPAAPDEPGSDQ